MTPLWISPCMGYRFQGLLKVGSDRFMKQTIANLEILVLSDDYTGIRIHCNNEQQVKQNYMCSATSMKQMMLHCADICMTVQRQWRDPKILRKFSHSHMNSGMGAFHICGVLEILCHCFVCVIRFGINFRQQLYYQSGISCPLMAIKYSVQIDQDVVIFILLQAGKYTITHHCYFQITEPRSKTMVRWITERTSEMKVRHEWPRENTRSSD